MVHSQSESDPKLSLEYSGSPHESKIEHSKAIDGATLRAGRRQRYDGKGEVVPLYRRCNWLLYFDWLIRVWKYFDTIPHAVAWLSCAGFVFGELLYIVGSFAADAKQEVVNRPGNCMGDSYDWLYTYTYFLGDVLWLPSVVCMLLEAMNQDFEEKYEEWFLKGAKGSSPRYRWVGFWWWSLEWWGAMCYFWAVIGYNLSSVAAIIDDCTYINAVLYTWITAYTRISSGILFLFAGAFYSMATIHIWLLPSIFLPYKRKDWTSMMWWAMWTHWWGGVCFCMTGIFLYWYNPINNVLNEDAFLVQQSIGFGFGSLLFHIGGVLMLARQARARCRPSVDAPTCSLEGAAAAPQCSEQHYRNCAIAQEQQVCWCKDAFLGSHYDEGGPQAAIIKEPISQLAKPEQASSWVTVKRFAGRCGWSFIQIVLRFSPEFHLELLANPWPALRAGIAQNPYVS
ncbi:hypothetical protein WJX84_001657 [Apatococcus fuscideae]|uniref:Uncharacterized protein n=1 Tax=Apatococcus fuscideae TaxID=2026836 RepID=A0AAW1T4I1_9CHLO